MTKMVHAGVSLQKGWYSDQNTGQVQYLKGKSVCNCHLFNFKCMIWRIFFENINAPLSGLFWNTEKWRSEELRGGAHDLNTGPEFGYFRHLGCHFF